MNGNSKKDQFLVDKSENLFINTALLELERRIVPNLYLTLT